MNKDKHEIIGQIQQDGSIEGGDSACWMGHYIYLSDSKFPFVKAFERSFGAYVRHPDPNQTNNGFGAHYKNPWSGCVSRDQLTGVLLAVIRQKEHKAMLRIMINHACRGFLFAYNTIKNGENPQSAKWKMPDVTLMDIWALELRGFGKFSWIFWPLLCVLDIHLLLGVVHDRFFGNNDPDVINLIGKVLVSREFVPTPTSWLAAKLLNKTNLMNRLKIYWCGWRDNCDFISLFEKKINDLI